MTLAEAARYLLHTESHVLHLITTEELRAVKVGRRWQVDEASVIAWKADRPNRVENRGAKWRKGMVLHRGMSRCLKCQNVYKNTIHSECPRCESVPHA